jgi:hypothetical protein
VPWRRGETRVRHRHVEHPSAGALGRRAGSGHRSCGGKAGSGGPLRAADTSNPGIRGSSWGTAGLRVGKTALVTGTDSGIGRATAITVAHEGAAVAVYYHADERGAEQTANRLVAQGGGVIVNGTSLHEEIPQPGGAAYCAAKGGLRRVTGTLALELARQHVRINNADQQRGSTTSHPAGSPRRCRWRRFPPPSTPRRRWQNSRWADRARSRRVPTSSPSSPRTRRARSPAAPSWRMAAGGTRSNWPDPPDQALAPLPTLRAALGISKEGGDGAGGKIGHGPFP